MFYRMEQITKRMKQVKQSVKELFFQMMIFISLEQVR